MKSEILNLIFWLSLLVSFADFSLSEARRGRILTLFMTLWSKTDDLNLRDRAATFYARIADSYDRIFLLMRRYIVWIFIVIWTGLFLVMSFLTVTATVGIGSIAATMTLHSIDTGFPLIAPDTPLCQAGPDQCEALRAFWTKIAAEIKELGKPSGWLGAFVFLYVAILTFLYALVTAFLLLKSVGLTNRLVRKMAAAPGRSFWAIPVDFAVALGSGLLPLSLVLLAMKLFALALYNRYFIVEASTYLSEWELAHFAEILVATKATMLETHVGTNSALAESFRLGHIAAYAGPFGYLNLIWSQYSLILADQVQSLLNNVRDLWNSDFLKITFVETIRNYGFVFDVGFTILYCAGIVVFVLLPKMDFVRRGILRLLNFMIEHPRGPVGVIAFLIGISSQIINRYVQ